MFIDKSRFTAEELAQYEALIAKGMVDPADNQEEMQEDTPPAVPPKKAKKAEVEDMEDTKKSAPEMSPEVKAAMEELATLKKSYEMDKMVEVAKKYAPLGKKEGELAQLLYDMKKSNEANYNAYIAILDESLGYVEKSGLFAEIGKSAGGHSTSGGAEAKAAAKAREIQKAHPDMTYEACIAKAWEDNPELMDEYDAEYFG
jgi:hypothetical protein